MRIGRAIGAEGYGEAFSAQPTRDDGCIAAGVLDSADLLYAAAVKFDSLGSVEWKRTFRGDSENWGALHAHQLPAGDFVVAGTCEDGFIIRLDPAGNVRQQFRLPGHRFLGRSVESGWWNGYSRLAPTRDGGFIVSASGGPRLLKTDSIGRPQWVRRFDGLRIGAAADMHQTRDGGYVVTGVAWADQPESRRDDLYLLKLDSRGRVKWFKTYGGEQTDNGKSVTQTADGGYVVAGRSRSFHADETNGWLVRTDSVGGLIWTMVLPKSDYFLGAECVRQTSDGGFVVTGQSVDSAGKGQMYLLKLAPERHK